MVSSSSTLQLILLLSISSIVTSQVVRVPLQKSIKNQSPEHFRSLEDNNSINVRNTFNMEYTGIIQLGKSKQSFNVALDTGSSLLWVRDPSTKYPNTYNCIDKDNCIGDITHLERIYYGGGTVLGYMATAMVTIGDMTIPKYNMVMAINFATDPSEIDDGILGLALGEHSNLYPTIIQKLKSSGLISKGLFSIYLGNYRNSYKQNTGELIFGGYDASYAEGDFQYVSIVEQKRWVANLNSISLGNKGKIAAHYRLRVLFDTGSSYLTFPADVTLALVDQANALGLNCVINPDNELFHCDCKARRYLPDLIFEFDGFSLNLPASEYVYSANSRCILPINTKMLQQDLVILGDVFLASFYTIYDIDNRRVGLAKAVPYTDIYTWFIFIVISAVLALALGIYIWLKRKNGVNQRSYGVVIGSSANLSNNNNQKKVSTTQNGYSIFNSPTRGITIGGSGVRRDYTSEEGNELQRYQGERNIVEN